MKQLSVIGLIGLVVVALPAQGRTQESPYAGLEARPIKALSTEEVTGYLEGAGMSLALPAELNGYPGPRHVLDAADALGLSEDQRKAVAAIFDAMEKRAMAVGRDYLRVEQRLDSLFAARRITRENLEVTVATAETLKARLRVIHLAAHLATASLLNSDQISQYQHLRGYHSAKRDHGAHE